MKNQVSIGDQNNQQMGQNPVNQPIQIPEKLRINYWKISTLILVLLFLGILGWQLFAAGSIVPTPPKLANESVCSQDNDCVIGIQTTACCRCPEAINKKLIGTENWEQYEFRKDYSSQQTKSCREKVVCAPCEWPVQPICSSGQCKVKPALPVGQTSFKGTVKTGAQLGEIKSYCSNGLYLVADEGAYLVNQTQMLQLRLPNQPNGTKMLADQKYVGKRVEVVGKYPAQENFCEALICECEDYILVDNINVITSFSKTKPSNEGQEPYQTNNFSIKYPSNWKISTKQIEYYDFPTLELTKTGGTKMVGGYELPQVWIGSFEIYSTSGAICANEPYCEKVDKISFTIKGKNYSTDVFKRQIWESGKFTGKYFYVFQVGSQSELDSIPSKPTITGQYESATEKSEIESILSSITY